MTIEAGQTNLSQPKITAHVESIINKAQCTLVHVYKVEPSYHEAAVGPCHIMNLSIPTLSVPIHHCLPSWSQQSRKSLPGEWL